MLPPVCASAAVVSFRWRILPDSTGSSGTIRFDDIVLRVQTGAPVAGDSLALNEIMYSPGVQEPEWIELYNRGKGPVDLRDWLIADALTASGKRITVSSVLVQAGESAVLTGDSAGLLHARPDIPSRVIPVTGFPSLNNSGDMIRLFNPSGRQIDSVAYWPVWGGGVSISLERIDPEGPSMAAANWATCVDSSGATPGRPNSVRMRNDDLRAGRLMVDCRSPEQTGDHTCAGIQCRPASQAEGALSICLTTSAGIVPATRKRCSRQSSSRSLLLREIPHGVRESCRARCPENICSWRPWSTVPTNVLPTTVSDGSVYPHPRRRSLYQ